MQVKNNKIMKILFKLLLQLIFLCLISCDDTLEENYSKRFLNESNLVVIPLLNYINMYYYANITVGTPPQPLNLLIMNHIPNYKSSFVDSTCTPAQNQSNTFTSSKSSTFQVIKLFKDKKDKDKTKFEYSTDTMRIGGLSTPFYFNLGLTDCKAQFSTLS